MKREGYGTVDVGAAYALDAATTVRFGVLNSAAVFVSDLIRQTKIPLEIDFVQVNSFGKRAVSGDLRSSAS